jgi:hypothetical protein
MLMKIVNVLLLLSICLVILNGCAHYSEAVFDKDGNKIGENTFDGDLASAVVFDLKDKIVFRYCNGILVRLVITPPSKDMPTGGFEAEFIDANEGYLSIPKETDLTKLNTDALSKLIASACSKDASVTPTGVNTGDKK